MIFSENVKMQISGLLTIKAYTLLDESFGVYVISDVSGVALMTKYGTIRNHWSVSLTHNS